MASRQQAVAVAGSPAAPPAAPLWAVQSLVFLASLGTGSVTNGIFFIAKQACGFSAKENFGLGVLLGVTYILGAIGVGPALRRVAARHRAVSSRSVLVLLSVVMAGAAVLPRIAITGEGEEATGAWSIWVAIGLFSPCSGAFWPIVESFLGGGRSGHKLRRAVGQFNIIWAASVIAASWAMGPLLERHALEVLVGFGVVQLASTLLVWPLGPEPGVHLPEHHEPHPPVYEALLTTFRMLLPTSYYILSVWSPYAPSVMDRLGVGVAWQVPIAATWMLSRFVAFATMERWHGWQGRWWLVVVGVVGMVGGIVTALSAPFFGGGLGTPVLIAGLAVLGLGNGVIYSASLYYAMEVGKGEVEAGGTHEALIGVGFAGGPLTGWAAVALVGPGERGNVAILVALGAVLVVMGLAVGWRVWRAARAVRAATGKG